MKLIQACDLPNQNSAPVPKPEKQADASTALQDNSLPSVVPPKPNRLRKRSNSNDSASTNLLSQRTAGENKLSIELRSALAAANVTSVTHLREIQSAVRRGEVTESIIRGLLNVSQNEKVSFISVFNATRKYQLTVPMVKELALVAKEHHSTPWFLAIKCGQYVKEAYGTTLTDLPPEERKAIAEDVAALQDFLKRNSDRYQVGKNPKSETQLSSTNKEKRVQTGAPFSFEICIEFLTVLKDASVVIDYLTEILDVGLTANEIPRRRTSSPCSIEIENSPYMKRARAVLKHLRRSLETHCEVEFMPEDVAGFLSERDEVSNGSIADEDYDKASYERDASDDFAEFVDEDNDELPRERSEAIDLDFDT